MAQVQLDDYLPTLEETTSLVDGRPLALAVAQIDEDPSQPRSEFDAEALAELAASIAARGVLQPVSVRPHPQVAGRYVLNFGARRLRASRLAGKEAIPAFVDDLADSYDQVIENEHREGLRPMELALFVQRQLETGQTQADVARRLGKSRAYVCYVSALIDPPDWLMDAYREGRCRGVKELYDLRRLHEEHPEAVMQLIDAPAAVSRANVAAMREQLAPGAIDRDGRERPLQELGRGPGAIPDPGESKGVPPGISRPRARWSLLADSGGRRVQVRLDVLPDAADEVFVIDEGADRRRAMKLADLQALRLQRE